MSYLEWLLGEVTDPGYRGQLAEQLDILQSLIGQRKFEVNPNVLLAPAEGSVKGYMSVLAPSQVYKDLIENDEGAVTPVSDKLQIGFNTPVRSFSWLSLYLLKPGKKEHLPPTAPLIRTFDLPRSKFTELSKEQIEESALAAARNRGQVNAEDVKVPNQMGFPGSALAGYGPTGLVSYFSAGDYGGHFLRNRSTRTMDQFKEMIGFGRYRATAGGTRFIPSDLHFFGARNTAFHQLNGDGDDGKWQSYNYAQSLRQLSIYGTFFDALSDYLATGRLPPSTDVVVPDEVRRRVPGGLDELSLPGSIPDMLKEMLAANQHTPADHRFREAGGLDRRGNTREALDAEDRLVVPLVAGIDSDDLLPFEQIRELREPLVNQRRTLLKSRFFGDIKGQDLDVVKDKARRLVKDLGAPEKVVDIDRAGNVGAIRGIVGGIRTITAPGDYLALLRDEALQNSFALLQDHLAQLPADHPKRRRVVESLTGHRDVIGFLSDERSFDHLKFILDSPIRNNDVKDIAVNAKFQVLNFAFRLMRSMEKGNLLGAGHFTEGADRIKVHRAAFDSPYQRLNPETRDITSGELRLHVPYDRNRSDVVFTRPQGIDTEPIYASPHTPFMGGVSGTTRDITSRVIDRFPQDAEGEQKYWEFQLRNAAFMVANRFHSFFEAIYPAAVMGEKYFHDPDGPSARVLNYLTGLKDTRPAGHQAAINDVLEILGKTDLLPTGTPQPPLPAAPPPTPTGTTQPDADVARTLTDMFGPLTAEELADLQAGLVAVDQLGGAAPTPTAPAPEPPANPPVTVESIRNGLPGYLRESRALGAGKQYGTARGFDRTNHRDVDFHLEAVLRKFLPDVTKWEGVDVAQAQILGNVGSLVGDGRPFAVKGDGRHYELAVRGVFDWASMDLVKKSDKPVTSYTKIKRKPVTKFSDTRDNSVTAEVGVASFPGLVVQLGPTIPVAASTETGGELKPELADSTKVKVSTTHDVDLPLGLAFSLTGEDGARVNPPAPTADAPPVAGEPVVDPPAGQVRSRIRALVSVPLELPTPHRQEAGALVLGLAGDPDDVNAEVADRRRWSQELADADIRRFTARLPVWTAVEAPIVHTRADSSLFDQVAALLGPEYAKSVAVGSHGRQVVQDFVSPAFFQKNLPRMAVTPETAAASPDAGWVSSDYLFKGKNRDGFEWFGKGTKLEMRAIPRWQRVTETKPGAASNDVTRDHHGFAEVQGAKRKGGIFGYLAGGFDTGVAKAAVGPLAGISRETGNKAVHEHSIAVKDASESSDTVRYELVYDVQVRQAGRPPQTLDAKVSALQWTTTDRARAAGLTGGGEAFRSGAARTHFAPLEVETGQAPVGMVEQFDSGEAVYSAISPLLEQLPLRKGYQLSAAKFVAQFDDPVFAKGLSGKLAEIITRRETLRSALTDRELRHLVARMLGPGLKVHLVRKGWFHDHHVAVTLRAEMGELEDGELSSKKVKNVVRVKDVVYSDMGKSAELGWQGGVEGRVLLGKSPLSGDVRGGVKRSAKSASAGSVAHGGEGNFDRQHGEVDDEGALGKRAFRQFRTRLSISAEITADVRASRNLRGISVGGKHRAVPTSRVVRGRDEPPLATASVRLLVPESLVSTADPRTEGPLADTAGLPVTVLADPVRPAQLEGASRVFDGAQILSFRGTEKLVEAAREALFDASGNDPIFRFDEREISEMMEARYSPEVLCADPRLYSRPPVINGLHYPRRRKDVYAAVGVALRPTLSARQVSAEEYAEITREMGARGKVTGTAGTSTQYEGYVTGTLSVSGADSRPVGDAVFAPRGVFRLTASPYTARRGGKTAAELESWESVAVKGTPQKLYLARVDLHATVAAEAKYTGNLDSGLTKPAPAGVAGRQVDLVDSQLVWLTRGQLDAMADPDHAPAPAPEPAVHAELPAPPSLRTDEPGGTAGFSIGLGGVTDTVDMSDVLPALREQLTATVGADVAARLVPTSSVDVSHDNYRSVIRFVSDVNRGMQGLVNGGRIAPIRLEDRFTGKTYYLSATATVAAEPENGSIEHVGELKATNTAKLAAKTESTRGRTLLTLLGWARAAGVVKTEPSSGPAGPSTGMGGAGLGLQGDFGVRDRKKASAQQVHAYGLAKTSGPVVTHRVPLHFEVTISRHGQRLAQANRDMRVPVTKLADESFPAPEHGGKLGSAEPSAALAGPQLTPTALDDWRGLPADNRADQHAGEDPAPVTMPPVGSWWAEHFFGDITVLRQTALDTLAASGATITPQVEAAIDAALTPAALKAALPAALDGTLRIPVPGKADRDLEMHIRIPRVPRFASVSAGVEIETLHRLYHKAESEVSTATVTGKVKSIGFGTGGPMVTTGGGQDATSEPVSAQALAMTSPGSDGGGGDPDAGSSTGPVSDPGTRKGGGYGTPTARGQVTDTLLEAPPNAKLTQPATLATTKVKNPGATTGGHNPDKITRVLLAGAEIRFVARRHSTPAFGRAPKVAGREIELHDAFALRVRNADADTLTGRTLPDTLIAAAEDLTTRGKAWTKAHVAHRHARTRLHEAQVAYDAETDRVAGRLTAIVRAEYDLAAAQYTVAQVRHELRAARTEEREATDSGAAQSVIDEARARASGLVAQLHEANTELAALTRRHEELLASPPAFSADIRGRHTAASTAVADANTAEQDAEGKWWEAKRTYDREHRDQHARSSHQDELDLLDSLMGIT